jgi:uncharacterized membrane protein
MDAFLATLQRWDLHPVVDHFTVSLLVVGVLIDLIASLTPTRIWLRYTALTLMILGALAAGSSYFTGDMEADRVWNAMSPPAKAILHWHAMLGEYFAVVFAVLAVWRILIQGVGFFAGSRAVYLIFAIISAGVLLYIGSLGGKMVYTYGVGTALMSESPTPTAMPTAPPIANESLSTVTVPTPTPSIATPTAVVSPPPIVTPVPMPPLPTATPVAAH